MASHWIRDEERKYYLRVVAVNGQDRAVQISFDTKKIEFEIPKDKGGFSQLRQRYYGLKGPHLYSRAIKEEKPKSIVAMFYVVASEDAVLEIFLDRGEAKKFIEVIKDRHPHACVVKYSR